MNTEVTLTIVDILAIVLSVVSLLVTIIGFFASLRFYRDGMRLQTSANDALVKIEEKAQSIQTQVGGMFDKTLDAAIAKKNELSVNFEELSEQIDKAKLQIVEEATKQIGVAGENERARLQQIVDSKIDIVQEKVQVTRESAGDDSQRITDGKPNRKGVFIGAYVPNELKDTLRRRAADNHLTLSQEITRVLETSDSKDISS